MIPEGWIYISNIKAATILKQKSLILPKVLTNYKNKKLETTLEAKVQVQTTK